MAEMIADDPSAWDTPDDVIKARRLRREGIDAYRQQMRQDREATQRAFESLLPTGATKADENDGLFGCYMGCEPTCVSQQEAALLTELDTPWMLYTIGGKVIRWDSEAMEYFLADLSNRPDPGD